MKLLEFCNALLAQREWRKERRDWRPRVLGWLLAAVAWAALIAVWHVAQASGAIV